MIRRNYLLFIALLLAIVAVIIILIQSNATFSRKEMSFAIADTSSITKMFLADMEGNTVLLERTDDNSWTLNSKYRAQQYVVQNFMRTMMYLTVRAPVAIPARENTLKNIAALGTKVEIYQLRYLIDFWGLQLFQREKLTKVFYVGDNTQDNIGTYMKMEHSDTPFIIYIPGFRGFVHTRFSTNSYDWRDQTVFNLFMQDIETVELMYPQEPEKSFRLENPDNRNFKVFSFYDNKYLDKIDTMNTINYLGGFVHARFEYFIPDPAKQIKDSLLNIKPYQELTIHTKHGQTFGMITYLKPNTLTEEELEAKFFHTSDYPWDRERLYAFVSEEMDLVSIQYYVFGRILKPIHYFKKGYRERLLEGLHIQEME
jgi:hypothetical protein